MKISYKKNKIDAIDFIFEIMINYYFGAFLSGGLASLLIIVIYKYQYAPSSVFTYFIIHPFFGILLFTAFVLFYFRYLPKVSFLTSRLKYSLFTIARSINKDKPKMSFSYSLLSGFRTSVIFFNIVLLLALVSIFWKNNILDKTLFDVKYTSLTDPGMWIWSLIYLIQILIIFFYLKYKYESPKQKPLIDKTMEIYNSAEAEKYRESKYKRYITVILLSGFWIFLHQIALILIRVFNQ